MVTRRRLTSLCAVLAAWALAWAAPGGVRAADQKPEVEMVAVRSTKLLYDMDEPVGGSVVVRNNAEAVREAAVRAWLTSEVDTPARLVRQTRVKLDPGQEATARFEWPAGTVGKYGHGLAVELSVGGEVVARGQDFFNVCDNYWNVALISALGYMWDAYDNFKPRPDTAWMDNRIAGWRKDYYNGFEKFFWAPDDFLELTPEREIWWSGQARYLETKSGLQGLIARAHEHGIKAITYAKLTGGGPTGFEIARRKPEWIWISNGQLAVSRQIKQIAIWDITAEKHWGGWVPVNWNMNAPKVLAMGIRELIGSTEMFGWDGARWDGNFDVWSKTYDIEGNVVDDFTREQVDARNAANMRLTKDMVSAAFPEFVYGYNWCQGNMGQTLASQPRETVELCRGGGLIMNEYIRQASGVQHPLHRWEVLARSVLDDVERCKALGGYYGPIIDAGDTPDGRYLNVFCLAAGAHPYYRHLYGAFATRYSAFIFDNALERVHNAESLLTVGGGAWWRDWVFRRAAPGGPQIIVHLINPPPVPTVGDLGQEMPAPLGEVTLRFFPDSLGGRVRRVARLMPEDASAEVLPVEVVEGLPTVTVPQVALWNVIVVELEGRGN